ncbi:hypothetical protein MLD38_002617 [Melastoma candidum]|uniref:Uncharacterized protein n=1 Tax=Melastoma candidum TaxID=119954 RepID=A0ACB9RZM9_9MYRT|nr:hypothetical protein MLD38_002617 [Melastoma candidum]
MVLSNKKLKQKLRDELLAKSMSEPPSKQPSSRETGSSPGEGSPTQSLRLVLDSKGKNPRLSKREKRRKIKSLRGEGENGEEGEGMEVGIVDGGLAERSDFEGGKEEGKGKDRKRKRGEEDDGGEVDGGMKKGSNKKMNKKTKKRLEKKKKMLEKKKRKKNRGEKGDGNGEESDRKEEYGNGFENGVMEGNGQVTVDDAKKIYVGGIPYYSTEDDIRSFFEGCGTITEIDCLTFPESESGKFRGIAMISFKASLHTEAAAKRALALDGSEMGGLFLKIKPYKSSRTAKSADLSIPVVEGYNRVYIGNLSWDITEDNVKSFFSGCSISSIRFGMDKETEEFKGYAHVDFSDNKSTTTALKLDQHILCGRPVKIMRAIPNKNLKSKPHAFPDGKTKQEPVPTPTDNVVVPPPVEDTPVAVSGKVRRRKCLICGEKGHLSYSCPKKPAEGGSTMPAAG